MQKSQSDHRRCLPRHARPFSSGVAVSTPRTCALAKHVFTRQCTEFRFRWSRPRKDSSGKRAFCAFTQYSDVFGHLPRRWSTWRYVVPLDSRIQRSFFVLPRGNRYIEDVITLLKVTWLSRASGYPTRKSAAVVTISRVGSRRSGHER